MQTKVVTDDLKAILQENRDKHHKIFLEAVEGYHKKAIQLLEEHIQKVKKGKDKLIRIQVYLPVPEDHTRDYDRIIQMVEKHNDSYISLTEQDFASYVQDDWAWKQAFLTSNSYYSQTAKTILDEGGEGGD